MYEHKCLCRIITMTAWVLLSASLCPAENIDPDNDDSQYAYGENVGWLNFEPSEGPGVHVYDTRLRGYLWAENIGWIKLDPTFGGVVNDGAGNLSGYAWGENVGWINFDPTYGGVTIDGLGDFDGWAWSENVGWIHFQSTTPVAYKVKTDWAPTMDVPWCWDCLTQCYGDTDCDGDVDTVDWPTFRDSFGSSYPSPDYHPCGDMDHDGDVDTVDWPSFRDNFGAGVGELAEDCPTGGTWPPSP